MIIEDLHGSSPHRDGSVSPQINCAGCQKPILEQHYLNAINKQFHLACFRCADCGKVLEAKNSVFSRGDSIYCRNDYYKRFAKEQCAACSNVILPEELVMRAKTYTYHTNCFKCVVCSCLLNTGDQFGLRDNLILCREHFEQETRSEGSPSSTISTGGGIDTALAFPTQNHAEFPMPSYPVVSSEDLSRTPPFQQTTPPLFQPTPETDPMGFGIMNILGSEGKKPKDRSRKRKETYQSSYSPYSEEGGEPNISPGGSHRPKRVRTSFKHHQTEQMKAFFEYNQNPDTNELKELADKTGLDKRILQVWFQNARAKLRRLGPGGQSKRPRKKQNDDQAGPQENFPQMVPATYPDDGMYSQNGPMLMMPQGFSV